MKLMGITLLIDYGPPLFTLLQLEMPTDGAKSGQFDQPLMARSHQNFPFVPAMKLLRIMLRNRCWPTTFHIIISRKYQWMVLELVDVITPQSIVPFLPWLDN